MQKSIKRQSLFNKILDDFPNLTKWASKYKRDLKPQIDMTREELLQNTSQSRHRKGKTKLIHLKLQEKTSTHKYKHTGILTDHPTKIAEDQRSRFMYFTANQVPTSNKGIFQI